jgi:hypothetical protein
MVYDGRVVFRKNDSLGESFMCSYDYRESASDPWSEAKTIPLWSVETGGRPYTTQLYLYNTLVNGTFNVDGSIHVKDYQAVAYDSGGDTLVFGESSFYSTKTRLRGQSIDIYAHDSTSGITIGRSGQNVAINGNVTINGSAPGGSGVTENRVKEIIESYGFLTSHQSLSDYAKKSDYVPKTGGTFTGEVTFNSNIYTHGIRIQDNYWLTGYIEKVLKDHGLIS